MNENIPYGLRVEHLVPVWWHRWNKFRRCGLAGGRMSLGVGCELPKPPATPSGPSQLPAYSPRLLPQLQLLLPRPQSAIIDSCRAETLNPNQLSSVSCLAVVFRLGSRGATDTGYRKLVQASEREGHPHYRWVRKKGKEGAIRVPERRVCSPSSGSPPFPPE